MGTLGATLTIMIATFFQGVILARALGPEGRGEYAAIILWPTFLAGIGLFGIDVVAGRKAATTKNLNELTKGTIISTLKLSTLTSLVYLVSLPISLPEHLHHLLVPAVLFTFVIFALQINKAILSIDQGTEDFRRFNITRSLINPIYISILLILFFLKKLNISNAISSLILAHIFVATFRLFLARGSLNGKTTLKTALFLKEGLHFAGATISNEIYIRLDQFILLWLLPAKHLGLYVAALSASSVVNTISNSSSFLSFSKSARLPKGKGFSQISVIFSQALFMTTGASIFLWLALPYLIPLVYGSSFRPATTTAQWLLFGVALSGFSKILDQALRGQGHPYPGIVGQISCALFVLIFGYFFAPEWGSRGVAIAYGIGQFTQLTIILLACKKFFEDFNFLRLIDSFYLKSSIRQ